MRVDVIIPVYRPDKRFGELLRRLSEQTLPPGRILVINTEKPLWDRWVREQGMAAEKENVSVLHVTKEEFDHGGTRNFGIEQSDADVCVCMTDDALPYDRFLLERLCRVLEQEQDAAAVYARQLPEQDCGLIERYTRSFNYPDKSRKKTKADLPELGIKTYFCSNVCAAYRREAYLELGGFTRKTIFNEDMIFAAKAMEHGWAVCYEAEAKVIHSHNYTPLQQLRRNFDLAVSQADHPEVFAQLRSEGEGIRLVKQTAGWLLGTGRAYLLPKLALDSGCKYLGYRLGKQYRRLPMSLVRACSMNQNYWDRRSGLTGLRTGRKNKNAPGQNDSEKNKGHFRAERFGKE